MLNLYTIFHLNLAYSSIEEAQQPAVIRRCYWPLLRLARHLNLPFGIEASGYTLERIQSIDPRWIDELRSLVTIGPCEFVGSGYAQIIGPLVPAEVNAANLRLGHRVYKELLGVRPRLALVNEQAYSAGVLQHYVDSGYRAIVMEWDNAARVHPEWSCNWRYYPQIAVGQHGEEIALIWNYSIAFQKFQRYAHAEMDINQYVDYLDTHRAADLRFFPLYGNDVEIFDFRPNRYHTEPKPAAENEWRRIERLLEKLMEQDWLEFVTPSSVLKGIDLSGAGQRLSLETPEQPIPVKKQGKYNITRWAVTGKNDLAINTACWRIYNMLRQKSAVRDEEWRYLCYLWSSDFRTHITPERWRKYCSSLETAERDRVFSSREATGCSSVSARQSRKSWASDDRFTVIETDLLKLRLNNRKGLAIDRLWFRNRVNAPVLGTLAHGFYDDISMGADFFSGHMIFETPGYPRITDLNQVTPTIHEELNSVSVSGTVETPFGTVEKRVTVFLERPQIELEYAFDWHTLPNGSLRLGMITVNPKAFDAESLHYCASNGGKPEKFQLKGISFDHGSPISFLVSASHGVGLTDGSFMLADNKHGIQVTVDKTRAAVIGLVAFREIAKSYFCRLSFSAREMDETCGFNGNRSIDDFKQKFRISIMAV